MVFMDVICLKKQSLISKSNNPFYNCDILYIDAKKGLTCDHVYVDQDVYSNLPVVETGVDINNIDLVGKAVRTRGYFNNFKYHPVDVIL